ncbi:hypothetical protein KUCAC02_012355, partial [Chaenocephalus aceratus]
MCNKDICNHFWYCCKTADHYEDLFDMWTGLLHHVTGEHSWALGACHHGPLLESREKEWIQQGSVAHQSLTDIILNAHWLKNVLKYLRFRGSRSNSGPQRQGVQAHRCVDMPWRLPTTVPAM